MTSSQAMETRRFSPPEIDLRPVAKEKEEIQPLLDDEEDSVEQKTHQTLRFSNP